MLETKESLITKTAIKKCHTGIQGFDEITNGGFPTGRATLVYGGPGCGKTLFGMEFLLRGATRYNEHGVFVSFEETEEELIENFTSLGVDIASLCRENKLYVDYVDARPETIIQTGEYNLDGLLIRLECAINAVKANRVTLDSLEALFSTLSDSRWLRSEIRKLFHRLRDKGVTTVITAELGNNGSTRFGFEEYVSDCVVKLDHRVVGEVATRRLIVQKYRGSPHGTNEYPFLISDRGISVLPITSLMLDYEVSNERVSSGISGIDKMLGGKGYFRGSTILISGTPGAGKTSIGVHFAHAACKRNEKCLFVSFEEAPAQIIRNMGSIGLDLGPYIKSGNLRFHSLRPSLLGLEMHLVKMHQLVAEFHPDVVIIDPVTSLISRNNIFEVEAMLSRLIDFMKMDGLTVLLTEVSDNADHLEPRSVGISSLIDTWLTIRETERDAERHHEFCIIKSRGMAHSRQLAALSISENGVAVNEMQSSK